jgi:hypothetical protein
MGFPSPASQFPEASLCAAAQSSLLRRALPYGLFSENSTPRSFQTGSEKTLARAREEFGLEATTASLGRYYRRRAGERQVEEVVEAQAAADELNGLDITVPRLREAALKLVGKAALKVATEKPAEVQQLVSFTKLLLESEAHDIQRERQKLAEKHFQHSESAAARKQEPRSRSFLNAPGNDGGMTIKEKLDQSEHVVFDRGSEKPAPTGKAICEDDLKAE